jgi:crossover junction endodeoxyribonuclease RuvC
MIAIGVDPGTRNLGWGVVRSCGQKLEHLDHGVIRVGGVESLSARLVAIGEQLDEVIGRFSPSLGSVEGMFFDKNAQSAAKLGHARGVVLFCLERRQVRLVEHAPAQVKRTLTGSGRAEKSQVARMVSAILSLDETPPHDASDALAIAITALRVNPGQVTIQLDQARARRRKMPAHFAEALARTRSLRS